MRKTLYITILIISLLLCFFSCYKETAIPVEAYFTTAFKAADESVPVQLAIKNLSQGADQYQWTFKGATPASSTDKNPGTVTYKTPGTHTVTLVASNVDGQEDKYQQQITVYDAVRPNFSVEVLKSNYPPVEVAITNHTQGVGLTYNWTFVGGNPEKSEEQHPAHVKYENGGDYQIKLVVSSGFESLEKTQTIKVIDDIRVGFDWEADFEDDDYQAPVSLKLNNTSANAISYRWTFQGATPASSTDKNPNVTFDRPGTYTIALEADNGKRKRTHQKDITILADTNLRTFTDIKFGINSAHNSNKVAAFFSTATRQTYTANQVDDKNGPQIDVVFSGLNSTFNFNKFISPDIAKNNGFMSIPDARHTKFINAQEICKCGGLSAAAFDSMTDDTLLASLTIEESTAGLQSFDQIMLPRIVLFETQDGRKGAIKVKGFISDEDNSYIIADIKVQKITIK